VTEIDEELGAVFACNPWDNEFGTRIAFATWGGPARSITCDRGEFLGRNGCVGEPAALTGGDALSGRAGAGLDPCAALQMEVTLKAGERVGLRFLLGQAPDRKSARELLLRYRAVDLPVPFQAIADYWDKILSCIQVETPEHPLNFLLNRWLLYQTAVCRYLARAAFYQAGGAYGFRDQLQDAMALALSTPELTRAQIVRASARQFPEGDVQHWWHPPSGRGVRTRFSDDRLWLPFVAAHYVAVAGDSSVLDETTPFLEGEPLAPDKEDSYFQPQTSKLEATVYEHCARAIEVSLQVGQHGLPLMGCGDWNDGMNRVGIEGKGESVWLGWFLYATLQEFAPLATRRGEEERAKRWLEHAQALQAALEREAWDGAWYRRAYYDDGTALGSASNIECRIDSLAQSWAVISGAADLHRARRAMDSVEQNLTRSGDDMILLFTPPFNRTERDPGYIKGYLPGVRENGAQYTHAAVWCVIARALLGDGDKAFELMTMLNPICHGHTRARVHRYKVEPYVVAADVYAEPPHVGRGGWTWYTGAAGWMYRAGIEYLLGFRVRNGAIVLDPCIPREWKGFKVNYRHGSSLYEISIENPNQVNRGVKEIAFDDRVLEGNTVPLLDDGQKHRVTATLC
jgi:cyclic beta-1,2-glucan synthetase